MGGCCYHFLKYLVVVFNLIYMLLGLALQGVMLWIYFDDENIVPVAKDLQGYNWVIFILMGVGTIMTTMGFLGCCGALQESECMLATFFALVFVLFAGQVATCAWIYANKDTLESEIIRSFKHSIQDSYSYDKIRTDAMDTIQSRLKCCGATGYMDWVKARFNNKDKAPASKEPKEIGVSSLPEPKKFVIPSSCCIRKDICEVVRKANLHERSPRLLENVYHDGCADQLLEYIEKDNWRIIIGLVSVAFIEILAMIFSFVLCCTARRIDQYKA